MHSSWWGMQRPPCRQSKYITISVDVLCGMFAVVCWHSSTLFFLHTGRSILQTIDFGIAQHQLLYMWPKHGKHLSMGMRLPCQPSDSTVFIVRGGARETISEHRTITVERVCSFIINSLNFKHFSLSALIILVWHCSSQVCMVSEALHKLFPPDFGGFFLSKKSSGAFFGGCLERQQKKSKKERARTFSWCRFLCSAVTDPLLTSFLGIRFQTKAYQRCHFITFRLFRVFLFCSFPV